MGDWTGPTALVLAKLRSLEIEVYNYREVLQEIIYHPQEASKLAAQALQPPAEPVERDRWASVERQTS